MIDLAKLGQWVSDHPEEASEPFMNVSTQRSVTVESLYHELKQQEETGVAIVDEDLLETIERLEEWLGEI